MRLSVAGILALLTTATAVTALVVHYSHDLPSFETLQDYQPPQTTRLVGTDGTVVGEIFEERRTVVPFEDIPPVMIQAITSAEDAKFFEHSGVDYLGMAKCLIRDLLPGHGVCGGSTLTQQTVKTMLLSSKRTLSRKIKEIILAQRLEKHLSKEQILYIYLNEINFGHGRYGIEEAARFYFGHGVKELTLGEAALLAAAPKWPNEINPLTNPKRAKERQAYVLRRMVENHFISQGAADREIAKAIPTPPATPAPFGASYIEEVRRNVSARLGDDIVNQGGLQIDVMMNPALQIAAESAVRQGLRDLDKRQGWRGALKNIDETTWKKLKSGALAMLQEAAAHGHATWGDSPLIDLHNVDVDLLEQESEDDSATHAVSWHKRAPGAEVVARVDSVTKTGALIDVGTTVEALPFASVSWARKYNPVSGTAPPKTMTDVLKPGDLVRIRVVKALPCSTDHCEHLSEITLEQDPKVQGAFVAIDPVTRGVVALVGGYDFNPSTSAFNRATQAKRQPGSAFKPFVYATALAVGQERAMLFSTLPKDQIKSDCLVFQPRLQVNDAPEIFHDHWTGKTWEPHNFERDAFDGAMSLRHALAVSKNTVAVKLIEQIGCNPTDVFSVSTAQTIGLARVRDTAHRAGIDSPIPDSITAALGSGEVTPLELVNAYTTLAAGGRYAEPILVKRVRSATGQVMFENKMTYEQPPPLNPELPPVPPSRGLRPDVAFVTANMMRSVIEDPDGTGHAMAKLGRPIAGKTGTASEHRDGWFVGFTPELVAGAWVGFDDHGQMSGHETGGHAAGPIWLSFMTAAEDKLPHGEFQAPPGVVTVDIDPRSGLLADVHSPYLEHETYLAGTEPKETSQPAAVDPQDYWRDAP